MALCSATAGMSQYHIRVECNPDNNGIVNSEWLNNYVISYTTDNWKTDKLLKGEMTWEAIDNPYIKESTYEKVYFRDRDVAILYAQMFSSIEKVERHEADDYKKHLLLVKQFALLRAKEPTPGKPKKDTNCCKPVIVH